MTLTKRISELLQAMNQGIPEREFFIQTGFLASVMGEAFYIFGRSGSGRSLLADRIASAFKGTRLLKLDRRQELLTAKPNSYDLAIFQNFNPVDDIAKENIQTVIHDRENAAVIISSEQRPEAALSRAEVADHVTLTLSLPESLSPTALCNLLGNQAAMETARTPLGLAVSPEELKTWNAEIKKITLSPDTLAVIGKLAELCDQNDIYISIRKWISLSNMVKAIAYFNGRTETHFTDTFFLGTPIWGKANANSAITGNFANIIKSVILKDVPDSSAENAFDANDLYNRINSLIRSSNNLYETKVFNNEPCLSYRITIAGEPAPLYVPLRYVETDQDFNPFNELRQIETRVRCNYHGTSSCTISIDSSVKGIGLRSSMSRSSSAPGKFEDFATLPSYILRENDPEIAAQKKVKLDEMRKEAQAQIESQTKQLTKLRDLFMANKAYRDDLFCNVPFFDKIQNDVRAIFDSTNAQMKKLKEALELFSNNA